MLNILLVIQIAIAFLLILTILLQKSYSDNITSSSSNSLGIMSGESNIFLTRVTIILAILFMSNSIVLANLSTRQNSTRITIEKNALDNIEKNALDNPNQERTSIPIAK